MGTSFRDKDGMTTLHVGVRVAAFAAVVGVITLAAGRWPVMPDELAAEQQNPVAEATSPTAATSDAVMARYGLVTPGNSATRDPSVPADADVIWTAKDAPAAPTF